MSAVRFWERGRIFYNAALLVMVVSWLVFTWPHFQPSLNLRDGGRLLLAALIANVLYSAVYGIDFIMVSVAGVAWRRRRWILLVAGTLLAVLIACYWIADNVYPYAGYLP